MVSASVAEFGAVETKDCDSKNELQEAQGHVGDDEWPGLAAGRDRGGRLLVEARECHDKGSLLLLLLLLLLSLLFFSFFDDDDDWNKRVRRRKSGWSSSDQAPSLILVTSVSRMRNGGVPMVSINTY